MQGDTVFDNSLIMKLLRYKKRTHVLINYKVKLPENDFNLWLKEIDKFVKRKDAGTYAENAFNEISDKIKLYTVYYQSECCMELHN